MSARTVSPDWKIQRPCRFYITIFQKKERFHEKKDFVNPDGTCAVSHTPSGSGLCRRGTAVYVSSSGNDGTGDGSADKPFATLAKAVDVAKDGATIYVMSDLTMTAPPVSDLFQSHKKLSF